MSERTVVLLTDGGPESVELEQKLRCVGAHVISQREENPPRWRRYPTVCIAAGKVDDPTLIESMLKRGYFSS